MLVFFQNLYLLLWGKSGFTKNEFKKAIDTNGYEQRNVTLDKKTLEIYKKIHDSISS